MEAVGDGRYDGLVAFARYKLQRVTELKYGWFVVMPKDEPPPLSAE
ncbi:hypothetical protein CCACVL1_04902 [Corchorus capsularis]|uniref:Uncharacterized protein n=1 Tax=Corchorus capsularis TaxID=210143 RepID=A0A1R3JP25_COCAP|nr:hypothetical protein CCACVL1_04902 [Corchorus capsularis]